MTIFALYCRLFPHITFQSEDVEALIRTELLDERAHPRARQPLETKWRIAMERIATSNLSSDEQQTLINQYEQIYRQLQK